MSKCTPAYNQETRDMMRKRDELARVAKGANTGDFGLAIRHKANDLIDEGHSAQDVLDKTHEFINQYAPHSKEEVAAQILGRKRASPTRTEAFNQRKAIRSELRDLAKLNKDKAETANKTRQTVLTKRLADIERRFRENDFSPPAARVKPTYSDDTMRLQNKVNQAQNKMDAYMDRLEARNQSLPQKIANLITDIHMGAILSSLHVYPKLAAAVAFRHATTLGQMGVVSAARMIPAIKRWAELAPRHGQPLTVSAIKAYLGGVDIGGEQYGGVKGAAKGVGQQLVHGQSKIESTFGGRGGTSDEYAGYTGTLLEALREHDPWHAAKIALNYPGRTHSAVKEFAASPEFSLSYAARDAHARAQMAKQGATPEQIDDVMSRESTRALMAEKALNDAYESKNQEKVKFSQSVSAFIHQLDQGGVPNRALAFLIKNIFPIRRIGVSIAKESSSLAFGGIKAATRALGGDFTETNAEYIMKNIAKQGVGAALFALGALYYSSFGGIPGAGKKDKNAKIAAGTADVAGTPISDVVFHGAPASQLQLGAGFMRLFKKDYGKDGTAKAALESIADNYSNLFIRTVPYTDQVRRMINTAQYGRGLGEVAGQQARSMVIPQVVQQEAAREDKFKGFRKPQNIGQDIETGIPQSFGLPWKRQNVPTPEQVKMAKLAGGG